MTTQADFDFISGTLPGTNTATNIVGGTDGTSILHTDLSNPLTNAGDFGRLYEIQLPPGPTTLLRADGTPGSVASVTDDGTQPSIWTITTPANYVETGVVNNPDYATDGIIASRDDVTSLSGSTGPNHYENVILGINQKSLAYAKEYEHTASPEIYDLSGSYFSFSSVNSVGTFEKSLTYPGIDNPLSYEDVYWTSLIRQDATTTPKYNFQVDKDFVLGIGEFLTVEWWMKVDNLVTTYLVDSPYFKLQANSSTALVLSLTSTIAQRVRASFIVTDSSWHNYVVVIARTGLTAHTVYFYRDGEYNGNDAGSANFNSNGVLFATGQTTELFESNIFNDTPSEWIYYGGLHIHAGNPYGIISAGSPFTIPYQPRYYSLVEKYSDAGSSFDFVGGPSGARNNSRIATTSSVCNFGYGDFTIDFWYMAKPLDPASSVGVFFNSSLDSNGIFDSRNSLASSNGIAIFVAPDSDVNLKNFSANLDITTNTAHTGSVSFYPGKWNHLCVSREAGVLRTFVNGVKDIEQIDTAFIADTGTTLVGDTLSTYNTAGLLEEFVIRAGTAKYTENFTPPTQGTPASEENNSLVMSCLKPTVDSGTWLTSGSNAYSVRGSFRIEQNGAVFSAENQVACGLSVKTGGWSDYQITDTTNLLPFGYHFYIGEIKDFPYYNSSNTHTNFYLASHRGARRRLSSLSRDGSNRVVGTWSTIELISGGGAMTTTYSPGDKIYIRDSATGAYNGDFTILSATSTGFVTNETVGVDFSGTNFGLLYDDRQDLSGFSKNIDVVTIPLYNYTLDSWVRMRMDVIPFGQWDLVTLYLATDPDVTVGSENWQKIYSEKFYHSSNNFIPYTDAKMHNKVGYFVNNRKDTIDLENIPKIIVDNFVALAEDVTP